MNIEKNGISKTCDLTTLALFYFLLGIIVLKILYFSANVIYFMTPDSWYYVSVAESLVKNYSLESNIIRQYQLNSLRNISFPPLWPILISIFSNLTQKIYYVGIFLNGAFLFLASFIVEYYYRKKFKITFAGPIVLILMLLYKPFTLELLAGMSGSLNLFLISLLLLATTLKSKYKDIITGLALGLLILNRFDNLIIVIGYYFFILLEGRSDFKKIINLNLTIPLILIVTPYFISNYIAYNAVYLSDNTIVAKTIDNIYSTAYFYEPIKTISSDFKLWLYKIFINGIHILNFKDINNNLYSNGVLFYIIISVLVMSRDKIKIYYKNPIYVIYSLIFLTTTTLLFTGYDDARYYVNIVFICSFLSILLLKDSIPFYRVVVTLLLSVILIFTLIKNNHLFFQTKYQIQGIPLELQEEAKSIDLCMKSYGAKSIMPFYQKPEEGPAISFLGYAADGYRVFFLPHNLSKISQDQFNIFVDKFELDAIYNRSADYSKANNIFKIKCQYNNKIFFK